MKAGRVSHNRHKALQVAVSPDEIASFRKKARELGLTLSDWVRLSLRFASTSTRLK